MLLLNIVLVNVIDGVEDCLVVLKGIVGREEIILLVDVVLILSAATDVVKLNSLFDVTLVDAADDVVVSPLLDNVFIEVTDNVKDGSLLDIELFNVADGTEEETDDVESGVSLESTLVSFIDVSEVNTTALLDITLLDVTVKEG